MRSSASRVRERTRLARYLLGSTCQQFRRRGWTTTMHGDALSGQAAAYLTFAIFFALTVLGVVLGLPARRRWQRAARRRSFRHVDACPKDPMWDRTLDG